MFFLVLARLFRLAIAVACLIGFVVVGCGAITTPETEQPDTVAWRDP